MKKNFFWFTQAPGFLLFPIRVFAAIILGITAGGNSNQTELLACQVETATSICTEGLAAWESLRKYRCELARTVVEAGLMAVGLGALPKHPAEPAVVAENERYRKIQRFVPGISADQYVSGLHIHVGIPDPDAGFVALNALRPWPPLLAALGANSPYWREGETRAFRRGAPSTTADV